MRILVIGAYGQFGQRIASELVQDAAMQVIVAGRSASAADGFASDLRKRYPDASVTAASLDVESADLQSKIAALAPDVVIHTAGPFQQRDYRVAEAALACGAHYIDLADGREFVMGIARLDALARAGGRWVVSGASTVPGLSAAVVAAHQHEFAELRSIESAISPGNRTARGLATTQAILGYVGQPFPALIDGRWQDVRGWQSLRRIRVPGVSPRWVARCDVPDLSVLPSRYPTLRHCDFRAGLELRRMHFGLWLASWLVRVGAVRSLARWARPLLRMSEWWQATGSDVGIMTVEMRGVGHDGKAKHVMWSIVARDGSGPQIPATAAVVLARKLARDELPNSGARSCVDLFTLDEFMQALENFSITATTHVH
ncbi:saccharopine dehydrogenase NADP-binding domain-containing protein [Lysobacter sp. HA18]